MAVFGRRFLLLTRHRSRRRRPSNFYPPTVPAADWSAVRSRDRQTWRTVGSCQCARHIVCVCARRTFANGRRHSSFSLSPCVRPAFITSNRSVCMFILFFFFPTVFTILSRTFRTRQPIRSLRNAYAVRVRARDLIVINVHRTH